jgi:NAD(P)-dependent dehydrogenase (short-subunit alcohol dehydrogenase family)
VPDPPLRSGDGRPRARRLLLVSSTAALKPSPYSANYSATKSYVRLLGEAVHRELSARGVHVSVLVPGATDTPMLHRFAGELNAVLRMAQAPQDCVSEGLRAQGANKAVRISGRLHRMSTAMTTRGIRSRLFANLSKSVGCRRGTGPLQLANLVASAAQAAEIVAFEPQVRRIETDSLRQPWCSFEWGWPGAKANRLHRCAAPPFIRFQIVGHDAADRG